MQVLITGYRTYTSTRYTIYYDDKMCHMVFSYDYGTTSFTPRSEWSDFNDNVSVPSSPVDLRPMSIITIPTSRANFYHLIRPEGQIAWKNLASSSLSDIKVLEFTVSWKRK